MKTWRTVPDTQAGLTPEEIQSFTEEGLERIQFIMELFKEHQLPVDPLTIGAVASVLVKLYTSRYHEDFGMIVKLMAWTWQNETDQEVAILPMPTSMPITVPESGKVH